MYQCGSYWDTQYHVSLCRSQSEVDPGVLQGVERNGISIYTRDANSDSVYQDPDPIFVKKQIRMWIRPLRKNPDPAPAPEKKHGSSFLPNKIQDYLYIFDKKNIY